MNTKRITALLLCMIMLIAPRSLWELSILAEGETATVIAGSDFQPKNSRTQGIKEVEKILETMKSDGITRADGFLFCGDYDYGTFEVPEKTKEGVQHLTGALSSMVSTENMVFVQGNHDAMAGTNGLSYSGSRDPESGLYGVFVINEDDYKDNLAMVSALRWTIKNDYADKVKASKIKGRVYLSKIGFEYKERQG